MKTGTDHILSATNIFRQYKKLADNAMAQLSSNDLFLLPSPESNSIAIIIQHMHGNMISRWTDFLTTDGEKPGRNRDTEFEETVKDHKILMQLWEEGWQCLFNALGQVTDADLGRQITIRSEPHSVMEAVNRQLAHYSYHVGQIVFIAKMIKNEEWKTLSIAKGRSADFNTSMKHQ